MQSLTVDSEERCDVTYDLLNKLVRSEARMPCERFGKSGEGLLLVAESTASGKNNNVLSEMLSVGNGPERV